MKHFIVDGRYKALLQHYGMDVREVLKKAQIPEDIFSRQTITMTEDAYYRLMKTIGKLGKDPALPIKMATTDQIESFSPPIFAAWCSKNGSICIARLVRYKPLIGPMTFAVTEDEAVKRVELVPGSSELSIPSFLVQSEFAFLTGIIRKAAKEDIHPIQVTMIEPPSAPDFSEFLHAPVDVGNKNQIAFRKSDLAEPFISANDAMWSYFEPELTKRLSALQVDDSVSARVRSALAELLPGGLSGIDDVAEKLGVSKRTLQRKLAEEHTTFQKQLNSTRETLALHYVKNTDMSAHDIAYLLGYAEVNSFLRAFSVWTGQNLTAYRRQCV